MKTSKHALPVPPAPRCATATRILIVDDHDLVCSGLRLILEEVDEVTVVATCGDCATAWRLVESLKPDLVLMDVELPDGDGIVLTGLLHATFPEVKVLVLSGRAVVEIGARALAAGARGILAKTGAAGDLVHAARIVAAGGLHFGAVSDPGEPAAAKPPADSLTLPRRESEVLNLVMLGFRNKEIAGELKIGVKTVETYRSRLMKRFGCESPAELVRHAIRTGLAKA